MSQRRSRYTVTMSTGEMYVVLAYRTKDARAYALREFSKKGRVPIGPIMEMPEPSTVISVSKGDYRMKNRRVNVQANGGFKVDRIALKKAIDHLKLKVPVDIRYHARCGKTRGNYRYEPYSKRHNYSHCHNIMLKSYLTPEQASETLWHELTHAMQAERTLAEGKKWTAVSRDQRKYIYKNRPIELEAQAMSKAMAHVPLCKP